MDHFELYKRIATVVEEQATVGYLLQWAANGRPLPTFISLIPHPDGTVTATYGELRERIIPVVDEYGARRVFADEASACEWAWQEIECARRPPRPRAEAEKAKAVRDGENITQQVAKLNRRWKAAHIDESS